jgi:nitrite reductase (NADH) large subunit
MDQVVKTYQCEWKTTVDNPEKMKRFRAFVNSDVSDPSIVVVAERGQTRPAFWPEKQPLVASGRLRLPVLQDGV